MKKGGFGRKMGHAPPGKPVTFYECHPEDHAPAPSVRADLHMLRLYACIYNTYIYIYINLHIKIIYIYIYHTYV